MGVGRPHRDGLKGVASQPYEINGLSLVVRDHGGGPDAIGFLSLAEMYLRATEKLIPDEKSFIPTGGSPESLLAGHALELLLKSFLLASGVQVEYLKKKIGHNLRKCLKKAQDIGIGRIAHISPQLRNSVDLLSDEYSEKHFEYFLSEGRVERLNIRHFLPEIRNLCEALETVYAAASKQERQHRTVGVGVDRLR
jgi:hypothetical protein